MYVESRKNLIYNEYFEELTNVLKDSEELLAYTQYEWYFFCFVFKTTSSRFQKDPVLQIAGDIFILSCKPGLSS